MLGEMIPEIVHPSPNREVGGSSFDREQYDERCCGNSGYPKELPKTVTFSHDPLWTKRVIGITCARNLEHPLWVVVAFMFVLSALAWSGVRILR